MLESENSPAPFRKNQKFTTTHWSVVLAGGAQESPEATAALENLCCTYWYPLYAYVRSRGHPADEAQDLTQEFFSRLIEKQWLANADQNKGRFRSFLVKSMNHFLANEWRRSHAAKRGGRQAFVSLDDVAEDFYAREPVSDLTPEKVFERRWALGLFERAMDRLSEQYASADKTRLHDLLVQFLSVEAHDGEYARVGLELGMNSSAVATAVHRMRQHYRDLVRQEVAKTVDSDAELEAEMQWLRSALE